MLTVPASSFSASRVAAHPPLPARYSPQERRWRPSAPDLGDKPPPPVQGHQHCANKCRWVSRFGGGRLPIVA